MIPAPLRSLSSPLQPKMLTTTSAFSASSSSVAHPPVRSVQLGPSQAPHAPAVGEAVAADGPVIPKRELAIVGSLAEIEHLTAVVESEEWFERNLDHLVAHMRVPKMYKAGGVERLLAEAGCHVVSVASSLAAPVRCTVFAASSPVEAAAVFAEADSLDKSPVVVQVPVLAESHTGQSAAG